MKDEMVMKDDTMADVLASLADAGGPDCESVETLHGWAVGELPPSRAAAVRAHVAECPRCAAEVRLAEWFEQPNASAAAEALAASLRVPGADDTSHPVSGLPTSSRWWTRPWVPAGLAAAALLVVAVGLSSLQQPPPVADLPPTDTVRGAAATVLLPRGVVAEAPREVRWSGVQTARYRVELLAVDETLLWSTDVEGRSTAVPDEIRDLLRHRVTYRLRITPLGAGSEPAGSGSESEFEIGGQ